ncbi:unnamed protein product, partial [marine sediment metagenome]
MKTSTTRGLLRHLGGVPVIAGQDVSGATYFVDGNVVSSGNGESWD